MSTTLIHLDSLQGPGVDRAAEAAPRGRPLVGDVIGQRVQVGLNWEDDQKLVKHGLIITLITNEREDCNHYHDFNPAGTLTGPLPWTTAGEFWVTKLNREVLFSSNLIVSSSGVKNIS